MPAKIHAADENTNENELQSTGAGSRKPSSVERNSQHENNEALRRASSVQSYSHASNKQNGSVRAASAVPSVTENVPHMIDFDEKADADEKKSTKSIHLDEPYTLKWKGKLILFHYLN